MGQTNAFENIFYESKMSKLHAEVEKAENMVWEATGEDVRDKYNIVAGEVPNGLGKYATSSKKIVIDPVNCEKSGVELALAVVHELLHAVEQKLYPTLGSGDELEFLGAIDKLADIKAKEKAIELFLWIGKDSKTGDPEEVLDAGDRLLDELESALKNAPDQDSAKQFARWYLGAYDKILNTIRYNAHDGHTDEWYDLKGQVEDMFDIKIPVGID